MTPKTAFRMELSTEYEDLVKMKLAKEFVEGFIKFEEGYYLYSLAKRAELPIVEIGSWKGLSTIFLALGSKAGNHCKVYAVDHHTGSAEFFAVFGDKKIWSYDHFLQNISNFGVSDIVEPILATSEEASKKWNGERIGLLWIDGGHYYNTVKKDYESWEPFLAPEGIIAFHDSHWSGPKRLISEVIKEPKFTDINYVNSIACAMKVH